ncbi:RHS repeat domain-containing protein [Pseudomonas sp. SBB6]|uniref:RHS repeat domain-containing protein n=1 Tax=Pseudomonas sp. SBB6 TaxID=2962032 RepID=UPI0020B722C6|nr:RHS repeat-associated core domain-containing protein [Pseudomonas sp. SBB6]MCP3752524.1 RHS repeat-associated core domain-containing protein [Pseudomonas sp. SBB6]
MSNSDQWLRGTVFDHKQVNGDDGFHYDLVYPYFLHSGDYLQRLLSHEYALQYRKHQTPEPQAPLSSPEAIVSFFNDTFASDLKDFDAAQTVEPLFGAGLLDFYLKNDISQIQQKYPQPMVNTAEMTRRLAVLQKNPQAVLRAYDDRFENMRNSTFNCAFDAGESSFGYSCSGSSAIFRPVESNQDIQADDVWLLPGVFYRGAYMPVLEGVEVWLASFTSDMSRVEIGSTFAAGSEFKVRYHFIVDTQKNTGKALHSFLRAFATNFGGTGGALSVTAGGNAIVDDDNLIPSIPGTQTSNFSWVRGTVHDHRQVTDMQGQPHPLVYPEFTRRFDLFFRDYLRGEIPATFNEPAPEDQVEPPLGNDEAMIAYFNETFATDYSIETYKDTQFGPQALIPRFDAQKDSELRARSPLSDTLFNNRLQSFRRKPRKVLEAFDKRFANLVVGQHYAAFNAADSSLGFGSAGNAVFKLSDQGGQLRADCVWLVPGLADEYTELPVLDGIETWWVLLSPDKKLAEVGVQPSPVDAGWSYHKIVVDTERSSGKQVQQLIQGLAGNSEIEIYLNGGLMPDTDWPVSRPNGEQEYVEPEWQEPAVWIRGTIDNYKVVTGNDRQDYRLAHPDFLDRSDYLFEMLANGNFPDFPGMDGDLYGEPFMRDDLAVAQFIQDHYGYPVEEQLLRKEVQGDSKWGEYFWEQPSTLDRLQSMLSPEEYNRLLHLLQTNPDMVFNAYDDRFANMRVGRDLASLDAADSTFGYSCAGDVIFQLKNPQATSSVKSMTGGAATRSGDATANNIYILPGLYDEKKKRPDSKGIEVWTVSLSADKTTAHVGMTAQDAASYPTQYMIIVDTEKTTAAQIHQLITGKDKEVTQIYLHGAALENTGTVIPPAAEALADVGYTGERYVSIEPGTGKSSWHIPVARLVGDDGVGPVFDLGIAVKGESYFPSLEVNLGKYNLIKSHLKLDDKLRLSDGRLITVDIVSGQVYEGEDYTLHANFHDLAGKLDVVRKNGAVEVFYVGLHEHSVSDKRATVFLQTLLSPSGRRLTFSRNVSSITMESISDDTGVLVAFSYRPQSALLNSLTLFPGSDEEVKYSHVRSNLGEHGIAHAITVEGKGLLGERKFNIKTDGEAQSFRIKELTVTTAAAGATAPTHTQSETLIYQGDNKVSRYTIAPGGGVDALTETYDYSAQNQTIVNCSQGWFNVGKRVHTFQDGRQTKESHIVAGVTYTTEQTMAVDKTRQVLTVTSTQKVDSTIVEQTAYELDARGNLIKTIKGNQVTEMTYFNNYKKYKVKEDKKTVHDNSVFGWLLKPLDYANPIGWGFQAFGSSGLTWGTRVESTISMSVSENNYAKAAFNLPVDVKYPGDVGKLSAHIESEFVYLKKGDQVHPQRLTYYGYGKLESANQKAVGRAHAVVPTLKLTVLEPDYEKVDITKEQLAVATLAAKPLLESLKKQKEAAKAEEAKKIGETITSLEKSLNEQSKVYAQGFKLKTKVAGSMQVEEIAYHTDSTKKTAFGRVKSNAVCLLDKDGKEIADSKTTTTFDYSVDAKDKRKVTTTVSVKVGAKVTATSSQTRAGFNGRLHESVDTEGNKTTLTYGTAGLLSTESVKQGDKVLEETAHSVKVLEGGRYQYESHNTQSGRISRVVNDVLGRECETWVSRDGKSWLQLTSVTYDARGRLATAIVYDYDGASKKHSTRTISWIYDSTDSKKCTVKYELKNAADTVVDSKSQVIEATVNSQKVTSGTFTQERRYDISGRSLTETFDAGGSAPSLKLVSSFSADGLLQSTKQFAVESGTEVELDSAAFSYTNAGLVSTVTPKHRKPTSYTYDRFGRRLTETLGSTVISNTFSSASLAAVAIAGSIKDGSATPVSLGSQTVDGLGRLSERSVNGVKNTFAYSGASDWTSASGATGPTTLEGYTAGFDSATLNYSECCPQPKTEKKDYTSTLALSIGGKTLSFTDVAGNTTAYRYDAYGRQIGSTSSVCDTQFEYADSGLLVKESIRDVKTGCTMTVTYDYDPCGNETLRTFECAGFDTLSVERTLLGDGRLNKSTLKVKGTERRSDNYSYDHANRLQEWSCTGEDAPADWMGRGFTKQVFSYDSLGNVVKRENTCSPEIPASTYGYHTTKPGALVKWDNESEEVDAAGRQIKCAGRAYTYHANGQVKTCGYPKYTEHYNFSYDDLGRIRGTTLGSRTETYHYRGNRIYALHQIDTSGGDDSRDERRIVLLNDSPGCLLQQIYTHAGAKTELNGSFELRDAAGSVFASLNLATKAVKYYSYLPYGYRQLDQKDVTWLGFKGEPLNPMGLYHLGNGYRLYDPLLQHFLTPDNWSPFGAGGVAAYVYCGGDPVNFHDPSGHAAVAQYSRWEGMPFMYTSEFRIATSVLGVLAAPFTGGTSLALAVGATGLAIIAFGFEIASTLLEESDPELSRILGYVGLGFGLASAGAGVMAARSAGAVGSKLTLPPRVLRRAGGIPPGKTQLAGTYQGAKASADYVIFSGGYRSKRLAIFSHGGPSKKSFTMPNQMEMRFVTKNGVYNMTSIDQLELDIANNTAQLHPKAVVPDYHLSAFEKTWYDKILHSSVVNNPSGFMRQIESVASRTGVDVLMIDPLNTAPGSWLRLSEVVEHVITKNNLLYNSIEGHFCRGSLSPATPNLIRKGLVAVGAHML